MNSHTCVECRICCCYLYALEPNKDCPIHGCGTWPPRCGTCGRFMKRSNRSMKIPLSIKPGDKL